MYRVFLSAAMCAGLLAASGPSAAKVVRGNLNLAGALEFSSTKIDFTPREGGQGTAIITDGSSGTFAGLITVLADPSPPRSLADIKDISLPPPSAIVDAIKFRNAPSLRFNAL